MFILTFSSILDLLSIDIYVLTSEQDVDYDHAENELSKQIAALVNY